MCGITGFISQDKSAPLAERTAQLDRMCRLITHRGPDEQGVFHETRVALGMRRLAIIDVQHGQQPMFSCGGNLAIVFNGEIYNYQELKADLETRGHRFRTDSDTETIVHAFEEHREKCLAELRGMFAFAIWDKQAEKLFLARDRAGKKPLFYSLTKKGTFVFGSELKTVLAHPEIERKINYAALDAYLTFGYVPEDFCIFENIHKLAPGHFLEFQNGKIRIEKYWDFPLGEQTERIDEAEYIQELRRLLAEAVKIRLIAEVPLGAFLSGGVDSSAIVAQMARLSPTKVKTFSIGFNTEHHEFVVTPDIVNEIDRLVWHFDEPFADSSALPTFVVSKLAREFVTVALTGDGGDELFAGYTRYQKHFKPSRLNNLPKFLRCGVFGGASELLPHNARGRNFLRNVSLDHAERYVDSVSQFTKLNRRKLYDKNFRAQMNDSFGAGEQNFIDYANRFAAGSLDSLLYLDSKTYLPADILTKVDRMSMAVSLEARAPLLDHKLIEFAARIPANLKLKNQETKYIFKRAGLGIVPDEILYRPKQGFGVPVNVWINDQLRDRIRETLSDSQTVQRGIFNQKYVDVLLGEHQSGRRDHAHALWTLFMLELWQRQFVDQESL